METMGCKAPVYLRLMHSTSENFRASFGQIITQGMSFIPHEIGIFFRNPALERDVEL